MLRQGRAVADGLFEIVAAHLATLVFLGTKGVEGVAVAPVDRHPGQAEQERVRKRRAHLHPKVAFLCAAGFVHQGHDVLTVVEHTPGPQDPHRSR